MGYTLPQDGANVNPDMQDWIREQNPNEKAIELMQQNLKSVAAKQMLRYNTYDPNHTYKNLFYNELNELNSDGYPHSCYNVAVSNGNFDATLGYESVGRHLLNLKINDYLINTCTATQNDCGTGSKMTDITTKRYGDIFSNPFLHVYYSMEIYFNPAYIPTWSGLDLVNPSFNQLTGDIISFDHSKFDDYVVQTTPLEHHELSPLTRNKITDWLNLDFNIGINYNQPEGGNSLQNENYQVNILHGKQINIQPKIVNCNGKSINYYFSNWEDGNFENPRIFYASHNISHTATLKGHLLSENTTATTCNSRRQIAAGDELYVVYSDMGSIWFTHTGDIDYGWTDEVRLGEGENPSINITRYDDDLQIVWEKGQGTAKKICYIKSTDGGETWSNTIESPIFTNSNSATPVVFGYQFPVVVWRESNGLHYCAKPERYPSNFTSSLISFTNSSSQSPTGVYDYSNHSFPTFKLVYSNGNTIYYSQIQIPEETYSIDYSSSPTAISTSGTSGNNFPSITSFLDFPDNIGVVWENTSNHNIYFREFINGLLSSNTQIFTHNTDYFSKPSIAINLENESFSVVWQSGSNIAESHRAIARTSATWSTIADLGTGTGPVIPVIQGFSDSPILASVKGTSIPFEINFSKISVVNENISGNESWSGNVFIPNSISINSGASLTIDPNTIVSFASGASLSVNGSLSAVGNSGQPITFTKSGSGNWGGIRFNSGSSGNIQYCNISNATMGVYTNGTSSITIAHNNISNCSSYGIYDYNSSPRIYNNNISNNGSIGIYCNYHSSPIMYNNKITGHTSSGLQCYYYSSPWLSNKPANGSCCPGAGHNVITGNNTGVVAAYGSNVFMGNGQYGGFNCVHNNNSYEFSATYNSGFTMKLENTFWGRTSSPYYSSSDFYSYYSSLDYAPALSSDPNNCPPLSKANVIATEETDNNSENYKQIISPVDYDLDNIFDLEINGEYDKAIDKYVNKLSKETNIEKKKYILSRIYECFKISGRNDYSDLLNKKIRKNLSKNDDYYLYSLETESLDQKRKKDYKNFVKNLETIKNDKLKKEEVYKYNLYNLGYYYTYELNDKEKGKKYFNELKSQFPDDELTETCKMLAGEIGKIHAMPKTAGEIDYDAEDLPTVYRLLGNYPNPFNPSTTIRYELPYNSSVQLFVYDIMGRKIKEVNLENQAPGIQSIVWDGRNENGNLVSSGVYIFRLNIKSLDNDENFIKTAKMIMLK